MNKQNFDTDRSRLLKRASDAIKELNEYIGYENDSYSWYVGALCNLMNRIVDFGTDVFLEEYVHELEHHLKNYQDNSSFVEVEIKPRPYTQKELRWNNE